MLVRIVKMSFEQGNESTFKEIFSGAKEKIANFPGCHKVELLQDINNPSIFFTISHWDNKETLNNYRQSELFKGTWSLVKPLFSKSAEAWSTEPSLQQ